MNRLRWVVLSLMLAFVPVLARAQEVTEPAEETTVEAVAPVVETSAPADGAVGEPASEVAPEVGVPVWFGDVKLWEIVAALVVFLWGIVKAKYALAEKMSSQVTEFLEVGVQHTYDTFVRSAKASGSGKLTVEQIKQARDMAWEEAKRYAKTKGVDLAKQIAAERLPSLISSIVNRLKNRK